MTKIYHVFTNNIDDWISGRQNAIKQAKEWYKEFATARVYTTVYDQNEQIYNDEDCIYYRGYFPN